MIAAGQFNPRGQSGGLFVGGMVGGDAGSALGGAAEGVGLAAGSLAGRHAAGAASGLPDKMLVGVGHDGVRLAAPTRHDEPTALAFQVSRGGLSAKVHQLVHVRVLELIHDDTGSRIELEGNRLPVTHSRDVIEALGG